MAHKVFNPMIKIAKLGETRISVSFHYNPEYVKRINTITRYRWHPDSKYWSFPNTNGTLEKILRNFVGEEIHIDPALQNVITRDKAPKESQVKIPPTDIKDYLVYLAEEKQFAASILNQAVNALKFYYGIVLKKSHFILSGTVSLPIS